MTRIEAIRARLAAATPGPWEQDDASEEVVWHSGVPGVAFPGRPMGEPGIVCECMLTDNDRANAAFIAHTPQDLRDLLELADAVTKFVEVHRLDRAYWATFKLRPRAAEMIEILSRLDSPVGGEGAVNRE